MPNWEEIRKEYEAGGITLKNLAEKHGVKDTTLRSRKNREKWDETQRNGNATQQNTVATQKKPKKRKKQKNRSGNPNPSQSFPQRNSYARKHGMFSRYIPQETLDIMEMVAGSDPADLVWMQIEIQFAAIIRSQQIMWVEDKSELIKELKKSKFEIVPDPKNKGFKQVPVEQEYEFQFAWDRQATFLNAQSRAMSELRSLIKQFDELAHVHDERRLKIEHMRVMIDKTKAEIERLSDNDEPIEILIQRKG